MTATAEELNEKIQGRIDSARVAEAIVYHGSNQAIRRKIGWIREWLQDPNTDLMRVKNFIKAVTGTTSLGPRGGIRINENPVATSGGCFHFHTCYSSIDCPYGYALDNSPNGAHRDKARFLERFQDDIDTALAGNGFGFA